METTSTNHDDHDATYKQAPELMRAVKTRKERNQSSLVYSTMWEKYSRTQLQNEQQSDPDIAKVYQWVNEKKRPEDDHVYLHKNQDGVRATEDVHFESWVKKSPWKFGQKGWRKKGRTGLNTLSQQLLQGFFNLFLRPLLNPAQSFRQLFLSNSQLPPPWWCHNPHQRLPFLISQTCWSYRTRSTTTTFLTTNPPHLLLQYMCHKLNAPLDLFQSNWTHLHHQNQ